MNNIEKLAIECGLINKVNTGLSDDYLTKLESFAKAYAQQQTEPVGYVSSGFEEQIKLGNLVAVSSKPYAQLTRPVYVDCPPATVPLEKYNKLLDALRYYEDDVKIYNDYSQQYETIKSGEVARKAIAEAEVKS